ncbi:MULTISPECIES: glutathione S-transferase N-terminal domain-containing protein [unclassified Agarivorans]|uniref:glutathione S-transferase N-terminal domain-containing protein n=1 Tax=unclassified Agarivorans TaxID=2636026 RepID=UPI003D7E8827
MTRSLNLVVGRGSTWSIRAYLCLQLIEFEFDLKVIALGEVGYREVLAKYSANGLVPVLQLSNLAIHDSLAIVEYLNECSAGKLFPVDPRQRAYCRSLLAELHSGFSRIRTQLPFEFAPLSTQPDGSGLTEELARLQAIWQQFGAAFAFGEPGAVDAFYAVMAQRLHHYGIDFEGAAGAYQQYLLGWRLFKDALADAQRW